MIQIAPSNFFPDSLVLDTPNCTILQHSPGISIPSNPPSRFEIYIKKIIELQANVINTAIIIIFYIKGT